MDQKRLNCHLPHCNKNQEFAKRVDIYPSELGLRPQMPSSLEIERGESYEKRFETYSNNSFPNSRKNSDEEITSDIPLMSASAPIVCGKLSKSSFGDLSLSDLNGQVAKITSLGFPFANPKIAFNGPQYSLNQVSECLHKELSSSEVVSKFLLHFVGFLIMNLNFLLD